MGLKILGMLTAALLACAAGAQQAEPPKKPEKQAKAETPAVIPAGVLRFAGKMEEFAPAEFLKWGRAYAKREIVDRSPPPENEAVSQALDARYPKAPVPARAAGLFLLWYLAYQEATKAQEVSGKRIAEADREIGILEDDVHRIRNTPVPLSPTSSTPDDEARPAEQRLESAVRQRTLQQNQLQKVRDRVDLCLQRLAALYETLKDHDPADIRHLL